MPRIRPVLASVLVAALCAVGGPVAAVAGDAHPRGGKPGPGALDPTFDKDGWRSDFPGGSGEALLVDAKGRILVAGQRPGRKRDVVLARILPGGKLDPKFGGKGTVTLNLGGTDDAADIAVAAGGRIVLAGRSQRGATSRIVVAMLGPKGGAVPKFGSKGRVTLPLNGGIQHAGGIAVDPKGRIVVGGTTSNGGASRWVVARLTAEGRLDRSFGVKGKRTLAPSDSGAELRDLALAPGGKIVVGGYAEAGLIPRFAVARLTGGGKLDRGFGTDGVRRTKVGTGACIAHGLATTPGGGVVLVGEAVRDGAPRWAIARYGPKGHLVKGFGSGGTVLVPMGPAYGAARAVAVQSNGRIVVAGRAGQASGTRPAVIRLKTDGGLHRAFGAKGRAILTIGGDARDVALQPNGRIVLTGDVTAGGLRLLTARLRG